MILVDASVWVDHFKSKSAELDTLLQRRMVLGHPYIRGEVGLGSIRNRALVLEMLESLPQSTVADHEEVVTMVERRNWHSRGIGYVDAHLLASSIIMPGMRLWTRDASLRALAAESNIAFTAAAG